MGGYWDRGMVFGKLVWICWEAWRGDTAGLGDQIPGLGGMNNEIDLFEQKLHNCFNASLEVLAYLWGR